MKHLLVCLALVFCVSANMATASSLDDLRQRGDRGDQMAIEQLVWGYIERSDYQQAGVWAQRMDAEDFRRVYLKSWVVARSGNTSQARKLLKKCESESCKTLYSSLLLDSGHLDDLDRYTQEWWGATFGAQAFVWHAYSLLARNELTRFDLLVLEAEKVVYTQPLLSKYITSIITLRPRIR